MVMRIGETDYIHISEFASLLHHSVQSIRYLCGPGGRRQMKHIRDGSRILIPTSELLEYPFTNSGRSGDQIFHYRYTRDGYERYLCSACTFKEDVASCPEARRLYSYEEETITSAEIVESNSTPIPPEGIKVKFDYDKFMEKV